MRKNMISNQVKHFTMNQMNPMYMLGADWADLLHFQAKKAEKVVTTIFCTVLGRKSGSFSFIWFILTGVFGSLSLSNEPNEYECSKGCSIRVFALSVLGGWRGQNCPFLSRFLSRPMNLKKAQCTSSSLDVHWRCVMETKILFCKHWWRVCYRGYRMTKSRRARKHLRTQMRETAKDRFMGSQRRSCS